MKIISVFFCFLGMVLAQLNYESRPDYLEFGTGFRSQGPVDERYAAGEDLLLPPLEENENAFWLTMWNELRDEYELFKWKLLFIISKIKWPI